MPVLSHLHQLFNADTCHAYIHTLRWKNRPLQCPRCHSQNTGPWGTYPYRPGLKRYRCRACRRTFNDLTQTRSPNLNAHCERFVRSIKEEALEQMVMLGERALYDAIQQYLATIIRSAIIRISAISVLRQSQSEATKAVRSCVEIVSVGC